MGLLDKAAKRNKPSGRTAKSGTPPASTKPVSESRERAPRLFVSAMISDLGGIGDIIGIRIRNKAGSSRDFEKAFLKALGEGVFLSNSSTWYCAFVDPEIPYDAELFIAQLRVSLDRSLTVSRFRSDEAIEARIFDLAEMGVAEAILGFIGD
ncbi:MAG: hypothetical protein WCL50_12700 [Spirochaetota bacterium]